MVASMTMPENATLRSPSRRERMIGVSIRACAAGQAARDISLLCVTRIIPFLRADRLCAFPGITCLATIVESLRDKVAIEPLLHSPKKKRPENRALSANKLGSLGLQVEIHEEFVRMRTQTKGVVLLLFHLDPVTDEVLVKDIAFEQEFMIRFKASNAPASESGTLGTLASSSGGSSYRFLSSGSPGSIRFWIPSKPANSSAAKAM